MNILYLAHRIPFPPNKGDKLRAFRQIEQLSRHHRVWCACFVDTPSDQQFVKPLSAYCHKLAAIRLSPARAMLRGVAGMARGKTLTESYYRDAKMNDVLSCWSKEVRFDVVVAFSSSMAPYALSVPARRRVLDLCDLDSQKWFDYAATSNGPLAFPYAVEGRRLAARERTWLDAFDATILITEAEAALLEPSAPRGKLHIVGNGVSLPDLNHSAPFDARREPRASVRADPRRSEKPASSDAWRSLAHARLDIGAGGTPHVSETGAYPSVVGFVGVMDYRPNVDAVCWFVDNCWDAIRKAYPQAVFRIVGRSPTRRVRRLTRAAGVEVVGEVDDPAAEILRFTVSVAPMRIARGLQNKVLEAMAAARPVVLSSCAARGLIGRHDQHYVLADTPDETIRAIVRLLGDEDRSRQLGSAARRYVATHHRWRRELQRFELIVAGQLATMSSLRTPYSASVDTDSVRTVVAS